MVVIASFAIFVVNESKQASAHQAQEVLSTPGASASGEGTSTHEDEAHKLIDDVSGDLTSPFSGLVSGSHSEWVVRGVKLLLALLVYGLGLGYLARMVRVGF